MLLASLTFALVTFTTFFPMVDPFGGMSIFAALTEGMPQRAARRVAFKACLFSLVLILGFAYLGDELFELFGITLDGLKVVGGIIFMIMGYDMLQARLARTKVDDPESEAGKASLDDLAITPLAIPILCGPGALTNAMLQMSKAASFADQIGFWIGTLAIMGFTFACLVGSTRIARVIGPAGSKVILRLMGLLLMVMAVESLFSGLTPLVRNMLGTA